MMERKNLFKGLLVFFSVALFGVSALLVTAVATGQHPADILFSVSKEQAIATAQGRVSGDVQGVETATTESPYHEVEVRTGETETDVTVDARTGDVVTIEEDLSESEAAQYKNSSPVTEQQAKDIAVEATGGRVTDFEVERLNGRTVYEVEIQKDGREADVHVDAQTGEIVEIEWEDGSDDD